VLLIGGGAGGMMGELLRYPLSRLQYVELDPALIRIMEPRLESPERAALRDPRVRVSYGDGRRFVKEVRERFDMVIVNTPDPSTAMLNRFYTRQFYEEVRAILAPGGVLATRLSAPADYYGEDVGSYAASVYRTLRSVFPYLVVAPGEENYFFASPAPDIVTSDIDTLRERWLHRGIPTERFTPHHFLIWWLPERVAFTQNALEARSNAPLNTDFKPVTYYFNLILWARFSGSRIAGFLRVLERVGLRWYLLPIACVLLARLVYLFAGGRRGERQNAVHALLAVGAMGFTAMALEIILIFAFQNIYGYVYQMMGVIVALFMAGLACGGFASNGLLKRPGRPWTAWLSGVAFLLAAYAAIVPWVLHRAAGAGVHSEYVFMALVFLTGAVTGMEFPLASRIYLRDASGVGRAAARVNGFDHFGACAGSLLTGVVFVPLIGIVATCIFLAALNSACGALLLTCRAAE
jgi:spermidine synthase